MIPFTGFSPSADEHAEGVITWCEMMLPTIRGMKSAPSLIDSGYEALPATCKGSAYLVKLDKSTRIFAGTQTKIYEGVAKAWVDSGGTYTGSADTVWRFAQFGDVALATNGTEPVQKSIGTGAFSDLAGAPKAAYIETVAGFVMLGAYNDGTDTPDGIYWSGLYDYTAWTPDLATQAGFLRLLDTPGRVTALKRLGNAAVAYKEDSMYLLQYQSSPTLWSAQLISGEVGALSNEAVVNIGTAHLFVGKDNIWVYDGTRPQPIAEGLREWFFSDLNQTYRYKIQGTHDRHNALVYFYYPSGTATTDKCIVYNYKSNKWGKADRTIESCLEYISSGLTYDELETAYTTYEAIPDIAYGSPFWSASTPNMAVFDTSHKLQTLTGVSASSSITTGAIGDDMRFTLLKRVQPRFVNI